MSELHQPTVIHIPADPKVKILHHRLREPSPIDTTCPATLILSDGTPVPCVLKVRKGTRGHSVVHRWQWVEP